jgi:hypothetical protein
VTWLLSIREKFHKLKAAHVHSEIAEIRPHLLNRLEERQRRETQIQEMIRRIRKVRDDYRARDSQSMPLVEPLPGDDVEVFRAAMRRIEYEQYGA